MVKPSKLKRIARSAMGTHMSLYQADDHLLLVEGSYMEEYRRFYFRDIKAALMRPRPSHAVAGFLLVLAVLGLGLLFQAGDVNEMAWVSYLLGFAFFGRLLYVLFTGGYCEFYLNTAAQQTRIVGVGNVAKARKITALIAEQTHASTQG
jgi:hypothetical protein